MEKGEGIVLGLADSRSNSNQPVHASLRKMMKKEGRDDSLALVMLFNHKSTSFSF
jgi:hypothetical protein